MTAHFPSAEAYAAQTARHPPLRVVDLRAHGAGAREAYRNDVLSDVNGDCLRLAVFEGEYRWHHHPDSDELFLVVAGRLQIDFAGGETLELAEWQYVVVPAGRVHRTRAIGRTANVTIEKQGARTIFVEANGG